MPKMHSIKRERDSPVKSPKKEIKFASNVKPELKAEVFDKSKVIKKEVVDEMPKRIKIEPGTIKTERKPAKANAKPKAIKKEKKSDSSTDEYEPETKPSTSQKRKATKTVKPKSSKKIKLQLDSSNSCDDQVDWNVEQELAVQFNLDLNTSINIVELVQNENTIPFIARYRREKTNNMDAADLRTFVDCYETLRSVQTKAHSMVQTVSKTGKMTPAILKSFNTARSMEELEHLYAPFKTNKKSLAERAKALGLDVPALAFLDNPSGPPINLQKYVEPNTKGLASLREVETGIMQFIADIIAKDYAVLKYLQEKFLPSYVQVCCKQNRNFEKKLKSGENLNDSEVHKFEQYYDFRRCATSIQPHQVMAINRGENLKILTVKLEVPEHLKRQFMDFAKNHFCKSRRLSSDTNQNIIDSSITDAYDRFIEPLVCRRTRSDLTKKAEKASVEIFASNLRNLLLAAPVQGKVITAIDPGFTNGCKLAVVAANGDVLYSTTLYLHNNNRCHEDTRRLEDVIRKFKSTVIGIGNGTACRQTETVITKLIKNGRFYPLDVVYCIVNESGVSVYSVSEDAAAEFPDMDPNQRSAVSLARRLLDPLSEHVKVEPKHLGVGMYQHDISEALLKKTLENVVEDCASFTGVDINVCSKAVLSKVAGLTAKRAEAIIKWRRENGAFMNREQILSVTGIGQKTYEQCAGFLRILSKTLEHCQMDSKNTNIKTEVPSKVSKSKKKTAATGRNLLDATSIHPESYEVATKIITAAGCNISNIGTSEFIKTMKKFLTEAKIRDLATEFEVGFPTLKLIADGLQRETDYDIRSEFSQPLFKQEIRDMNCLENGMRLSGKVMNVTSFGVFVDIGVGCDGLIHNSQLSPSILKGQSLAVGDYVQVKILQVNEKLKRIGLSLAGVTGRSRIDLR